jgi:hypothetical protein
MKKHRKTLNVELPTPNPAAMALALLSFPVSRTLPDADMISKNGC